MASAGEAGASASQPLPAAALPLKPAAYLRGQVQVDANYLLSKGFGSLVSNNGSAAIQVTGLLSNNGSTSLNPQAAAGLVANHGGGLISNHGGALLSAGGGLLSNNGSTAIQPQAAYRGLLQAAASPALGGQLPAAGMALRAFDLGSGEALPLVGPAGEALGAVLSGPDGGYALVLGKAPTGQVLVTAEVPGRVDPRLALRTFAQAEAEPNATAAEPLNEERNVAIALMRVSFQRRLAEALAVPDLAAYDIGTRWSVPQVARTLLVQALEALRAEAKAAGFLKLNAAQQRQVGAGAADAILATLKIEAMRLDPKLSLTYQGPSEPAVPALLEILRFTSKIAADRMATDPLIFDADADVMAFNQTLPEAERFFIRRPADFNAFFMEAFMTKNDSPILATRAFVSRYGNPVDPVTGVDQIARLKAGVDTATNEVGQSLLIPERGGMAAAVARIRAGCKALGVLPAAEAVATGAAALSP